MANLNAVGDMIVITADIKDSDFDAVKKHAPDALTLRNEEGNVYFAVDRGNANVSKYGICFSSRNQDGNIFMTTSNVVVGFHEDVNEERKIIEEEFAVTLANLIKVEEQVNAALGEIQRTINQVADSITVQ